MKKKKGERSNNCANKQHLIKSGQDAALILSSGRCLFSPLHGLPRFIMRIGSDQRAEYGDMKGLTQRQRSIRSHAVVFITVELSLCFLQSFTIGDFPRFKSFSRVLFNLLL